MSKEEFEAKWKGWYGYGDAGSAEQIREQHCSRLKDMAYLDHAGVLHCFKCLTFS